MKLLAVCLGHAEKLPGKSYKTGINKHAVNSSVMIDREGLVGDAVCNGKYHGGPEQAVLLEGSLTMDWWSHKLDRPLPPGTFGENLVIEGLDNRDVSAGDRFVFENGLELQATSARTPCATLAARMGDPSIVKTYRQAMRPGIYCRVLKPGMAMAGDGVEHIRHDGANVPIPEMLEKFGKRLVEADAARFLDAPIHADMREAIIAGKPAKF
ncbi:MOSC domain-containing protein [Neorhizobium sp. JUb45]|uniref:MOSC domain-containing protein n=1 Tax=unclassified Neorhizobium TaxID=2629175 RepID=UPI0010486BD5|nr:MOSC domain-containing protein [Neorhizobium sp. JUb45]TCR01802.1 MOSC domain-containing protein YiiM [Neorhizobium sp. JUb45]